MTADVVDAGTTATQDSPQRAAAAYRWNFISLGARTGFQAVSGVLIARSVDPSSFGRGMLVVSFYLVASAVVLQGANGPLIVRSRVTAHTLRRVLLADVALAVTAAVVLLVAGAVQPARGSTWVALVIAAGGCLVLGLGGPGRALASRELAFRRTGIGEVAGSVVGALVAVLIAASTHSAVIALPLQVVIVDACGLVATAGLLLRPVPDLPATTGAEPGVRYAVQTAGNQLASMGSRNVPNWLVAGLLGSHALGIYSLAYRLMMLPVQNVAMVLSRVLLPRLRRMGDDTVAIQGEVVAVIAAIALVVGPFSGALLPHLDAAVTTLFGQKWAAAAVPTAALLVAVFPQCCTTLASSVLASQGHGGEQLRMTLVQLAGAVVATVAGSPWGLNGVAVALVISFVLLSLLNVVMVQVRTGVSSRTFGVASLLYLACTAFSYGASWGAGRVLGGDGPGVLLALAVGGVLGLAAGSLVLPGTARSGWTFWWSMTPWARPAST